MKNIYTWSAELAQRNLTIADLKAAKGKKKFTQVRANTIDEAYAAEEAGIDMIISNSKNVNKVRKGSNKLFLTIEDRFFNGSEYNFSYFYGEDDIKLPTTVSVKMSGVSKEFYTYYRVLIDQSGQNSGGPFETVPSSLLGNMINTSYESKFPLGYFHISETDSISLNLIEKN